MDKLKVRLLDTHRHVFFFVLHIILLCTYILPLWNIDHLPFVDYPNHLTRSYLIRELTLSPGTVTQYLLEWHIDQNLGFETLYFIFASFFSPYTTGKIITSLSFILTISGVITLSRILYKQWRFETLLAYLCLYNYTMYYGFMNFNLSVALCLFGIAFWIKCEDSPIKQYAVAFLFIHILFFTHLLGYFFYGLVIGTRLFQQAIQKHITWFQFFWKNGILLLLSLPTLAAILFYSGKHGFPIITTYEDFSATNLFFLTSPFSFIFPYGVLLLYLLFLATCISLPLAILKYIKKPYKISLPTARFFTLPLSTLLIIMLAVPNTFYGVWGASYRTPLVFTLLFIASIALTTKNKVILSSIITIGLTLGALGYTVTNASVNECASFYHDYMEGLNHLEKHKRLLTITNVPELKKYSCIDSPRISHASTFGVIEKDLFVPELFTGTPPIKTAPHNVSSDTTAPTRLPMVEFLGGKSPILPYTRINKWWLGWQKKFHYIAVLGDAPDPNVLPSTELIYSHGDVHFYRNRTLFTQP